MKVGGRFHLPAGSLCGPLEFENPRFTWATFRLRLNGPGPFINPHLIVAAESPDQENIAIPLTPVASRIDEVSHFKAIISRQRLQSELWIVPSLSNTVVTSMTYSANEIRRFQAGIEIGKKCIENPGLLVKSLRNKNLGFTFQPWEDHVTLTAKMAQLKELASRNVPNPDIYKFGINPRYNDWLNRNYQSLIPRSKPATSKLVSISTAAVTLDKYTSADQIALTVNSLLSAGITMTEICLILADETDLDLADFRLPKISEKEFQSHCEDLNKDTFLLILRAGDTIARDLGRYLDTVGQDFLYQLIYFDNDYIDPDGGFKDFVFKPDNSPVTLLFNNYVRRSCLISVGLVTSCIESFDELENHSIWTILYTSAMTASLFNQRYVLHMPRPCIHLSNEPETIHNEIAKFEDAAREIILGKVAPDMKIESDSDGVTRWKLRSTPERKVSIIIPTRDRLDLLKPAVESVIQHTSYPNYELVIVDNLSQEIETFKYLSELSSRAKIFKFIEPFNFARLHNRVIEQLDTDLLLLLNNDTQITSKDWLSNLVSLMELPNVGVVGNKLLYPDLTIQHIGATGGLKGPMSHHLVGIKDLSHPFLKYPRDVLAVTGACLLIAKTLYLDIGGMDEALEVSYNDMDLCLSVRHNAGKSVIVSSSGGVIHKESKSRGKSFTEIEQQRLNLEAAYFESKWHEFIRPDPFYNPNLSLDNYYDLL